MAYGDELSDVNHTKRRIGGGSPYTFKRRDIEEKIRLSKNINDLLYLQEIYNIMRRPFNINLREISFKEQNCDVQGERTAIIKGQLRTNRDYFMSAYYQPGNQYDRLVVRMTKLYADMVLKTGVYTEVLGALVFEAWNSYHEVSPTKPKKEMLTFSSSLASSIKLRNSGATISCEEWRNLYAGWYVLGMIPPTFDLSSKVAKRRAWAAWQGTPHNPQAPDI